MGRPSTLQIRVTSDSQQARRDIDGASREITGSLDKLKKAGPAVGAAAAAAVGLAIGAALSSAFAEAMDRSKIKATLSAQLGATPAEAKKFGELAGKLYTEGVTDDFQGAADAIRATFQNLDVGDRPAKDLQKLATRAADLGRIMERDVGDTTRAVGQILRTGLAKNAEEAFDVLTRGVQTGANAADDLLDTFSEYSTQFRDLGLTADQALGIIRQGLKGGARDSDLVADALKELNLRTQALANADALKELGLDAKFMAGEFASGGPKATEALDSILDKLRAVKDPAERSRLAVELFGTQFEDMSQALLQLDPSTAVKGLGDVKGASDAVATSLRDNAGAELERFRRQAFGKLVDIMEQRVIPALRNLYRFFQENIAPVLRRVGDILKAYLLPLWDAFRQGLDRVREALRRNRGELKPVWDLLLLIAKASGLAAARGLGIMFNAIIDVINGLATLVSWLRTAWEWINRVNAVASLGIVGSGGFRLFSAPAPAPAAAAADGPSLFAADPFAVAQAAPRLTLDGMIGAVQVFITIDGQQLQGRIDRTVVRGLNSDGAVLAAGGSF